MIVLLSSVVDVTVVLACALMLVAGLRRRSAALRHMVLAAAIVAAALSPALEGVLPQLPVIHWSEAVTAPSFEASPAGTPLSSSSSIEGMESSAPGVPWGWMFVGIWSFGAIVALTGLVAGLARLARVTAQCTPIRAGRWRNIADELSRAYALRRRVDILQSRERTLLVTCGFLQPTIVLPAGAEQWTDGRVRSVLVHELAHIRRFDGALQLTGEIVRVIHWWNPLVWLVCGRLRRESEHACDDAVLNAGVEATEYAAHLLGVARHAAGARLACAAAPAMAHPSTLERRVAAMLSQQQRRTPLPSHAWIVAAVVTGAVIVPLAAAGVASSRNATIVLTSPAGDVEVEPQTARPGATPVPAVRQRPTVPRAAANSAVAQLPGSIVGTMRDQTGGVLPGVMVTLAELETDSRFATVTDAEGRFRFRDLQPSRYELAASLPGFATVTNVVALESGASLQRLMTMPIGTVQELITVTCGDAVAIASPAAFGGPGSSASRSTDVSRARLSRIWQLARQSLLPVVSAQERVPVRVGGNIRAPMKVTDVRPICPRAPAADTMVRLVARIGVDGDLSDLRAIAAAPDASPSGEFTMSAFDAARQWRFIPTQLNGVPVEAGIAITVVYRR